MYIHIYTCVYVCVYIKRERERKDKRVGMRNFSFPGGHVVTIRGIELQLCCTQLLKVKVTSEFTDGFHSCRNVHWMHKEMQTNKEKAIYSIPWLLLSMIAKMKVKESAGSGLEAGPSSDVVCLSSSHQPQNYP